MRHADNNEILNGIYREALSRETMSQRISRQYRKAVAKYRYGDGTPLDLYYAPRNEFISVFGLEAYIDEYLGYDVDEHGAVVFIFEDRGDDIFSKGKPVTVETIPYYLEGSDDLEWYLQIHPAHKIATAYEGTAAAEVANDNIKQETSRAA